jgi:hypothetical protein
VVCVPEDPIQLNAFQYFRSGSHVTCFFLEIADKSLRFEAGVTSPHLKIGLHAISIALAP